MLSKIIKIIIFVIVIAFALIFMYLFDLPPFNEGKNQEQPVPQNTESEQNPFIDEKEIEKAEASLPEELKESPDRIARTKTYEEIIKRAQLLENGEFNTLAIAEYQNAYLKNPSKIDPLYEIGRLHIEIGNFDKAQKTYELILEKDPESIDAKIYLGKALLNQREIQKARDIFDAIESDEFIVKYYQGILAAYYEDHAKAKQLLQNVAESSPDQELKANAESFLNAYREFDFNVESPSIHLKVLLARSYNQVEEYEIAIPLLFTVTKEKLDYRDAWILLGYAYLKTEKYMDAIEALERAKVLDPQKAETNFFLGIAYYTINDYEKAEDFLLKARDLNFQPKIQIDQKLAEIYLQQKNYEKAALNYSNVLAINDQDINYYIRPIWIYIEKLQQPEKALELSKLALESHPRNAMSHNLMAWSLIYNENFELAESHLNQAMAIDPNLDAVYLNYGILFEQQGDLNKAVNFYKKAHNLGSGSGVSGIAANRYNSVIAKIYNKNIQVNTLAQ
ncbi:tetratricopeptide repeat protein [Candidatus Peregrinibacteria bacterium]|nr:tetratricopeptide repeat protein [Candidatus Peregrinibacteria bacterium]